MGLCSRPRVHEYIREMNAKVLSSATLSVPDVIDTKRHADYDIITVGEAPFSHSADDIAAYVFPKHKELDMVFQFELMDIDQQGVQRVRPRPSSSPADSPV